MYSRLFALSEHPLAILGIDGRIHDANPVLARCLGFDRRELVGRSALQLIHPEDKIATLRHFFRVTVGDGRTRCSVRLIASTGRVRRISWSWIFNDETVYAFGTDVTEERMQLLLETGTDGICVVGSDWRILHMTARRKSLLPPNMPDFKGRDFWEAFPAAVGTIVEKNYREVMSARLPVRFEAEYPPRGEWFEVSAFPWEDGISIFFRSITARKNAEAEIERQRRQMVASSKMSALGKMAGNIAHEINNPLAIIHGRAGQLKELVEAGDIPHEKLADIAEKIEVTALRISKIVRGLRMFARETREDPRETTDLQRIVSDTLELCGEKFRSSSIALRIGSGLSELQISCNPIQIAQVLLNLLNNAYDAIEAKQERWIAIEGTRNAASIQIRITDSGEGISSEVKMSLQSDPFYSSKDAEKGAGLGLAISREIVARHGGSILLDETSHHTCWVVSLPSVKLLLGSPGDRPFRHRMRAGP